MDHSLLENAEFWRIKNEANKIKYLMSYGPRSEKIDLLQEYLNELLKALIQKIKA